MNKLFLCALLGLFLTISAPAQTPTREQLVGRVTQAMDTWQQGGQPWRGRLEGQYGLGNIYLQYPGKVFVDWDTGQDVRAVGDDLRVPQNNNTWKFVEDPLWILAVGKIGKDVEIEMVDTTGDSSDGASSIVVADLIVSKERAPKTRLRVYVSGEGNPTLLGWGYQDRIVLRDFRPFTPKTDIFSEPKL